MRSDEIRHLLQERVGEKVTDKDWKLLERMEAVKRVLNGDATLDFLSERFWDMREYGNRMPGNERFDGVSPSPGRASRRPLYSIRAEVLSGVYRRMADRDPQVKAFREDALDGKLMPWEAVESWIRDTAASERDRTHFLLQITVPDQERYGQERLPRRIEVTDKTPRRSYSETLDFARPTSHYVERVVVSVGGVLDRLRLIAGRLAKQFAWQEAGATVYVLTGKTPVVRFLKVSTTSFVDPNRERVIVEADPYVPPSVVARAFREARQRNSLVHGPRPARIRNLSERHLRLVDFIDERAPTESWKNRTRAWNRKFREWKYSSESNLKRDFYAGCANLEIAPDNDPE